MYQSIKIPSHIENERQGIEIGEMEVQERQFHICSSDMKALRRYTAHGSPL